MLNVVSNRTQKKRGATVRCLKEDSTSKYTLVKSLNSVSGVNKGTIGCVCVVQVGASAEQSRGQGDIVRVFFLFESRRGNGTKLFTSLKHNPAGTMRKAIIHSMSNIYYLNTPVFPLKPQYILLCS